MNQRKFSIRDIAQEAKVSSATVSRVFAGSAHVSAETQALVLKIAQEHGYEPKVYQKRQHHVSADRLVGIVAADLRNPFFLDTIGYMEAVLAEQGIDTVICNSNESTQKEIRILSMLKGKVDGIIISPISENAEYNVDFLRDLNATGTPIVLIDRDLKGVGLDGVFQDDYNVSLECVDALIQAGHKNIAIIAGPISSKPGLERLNGYMDSLKAHNIPTRKEYIAYGDFKADSAYHLTLELLEHHPEITAIFCCNNMMAIGAIRAIYGKGMCIPQDIALIAPGSVDALDLVHSLNISEINQPIEQMAEEAAGMMIEKLSGNHKRTRAVRRITYEGRLILRGSEAYPSHRK